MITKASGRVRSGLGVWGVSRMICEALYISIYLYLHMYSGASPPLSVCSVSVRRYEAIYININQYISTYVGVCVNIYMYIYI